MNFLMLFTLAFGVSFVLTLICIPLAKKYGFIDDPTKHKHPALIHKKSLQD